LLTPEYLDGIAEPIQEIYSELQSKIMADIARRIAKSGEVIPSSGWQIVKMQELGASQQYIAQEIARTLKLSDKEVKTIFKAAGIKSLKPDIELQKAAIAAGKLPADTIPITASASVAQVLNANAIRTLGTMKRLTGTIAIDASGKLNQYMDQCQLMVQSGAFTEQQAIEATVRKFAADGVGCFDYRSGVRTSIEAAVRRACVTGVNQATSEISLNNAAELGTDLVEVTSHADARPEHALWQGGIYSLSGTSMKYKGLVEATGYGTGAGLCGWNCRHSFFPYIEGVSEKLPQEKYDPKTYEAEQEQRYNERQIRYWKRRAATLEAGGVDNTKELLKVRRWQTKQQQFIDESGLARLYGREQVPGFGSSLAQKALKVEKAEYTGIVNALGKDKAPANIDIYSQMKYNNTKEYQGLAKEYKAYNQEKWARDIIDANSDISDYKVFDKAENIPQWAKDQAHVWTQEEKDALTYYTSHEYSKINDYLRGKETAGPGIVKKINQITDAIEKADIKENIVVWRGTHLSNFTQAEQYKLLPVEQWADRPLRDLAFSSTSMLKDSAFTDKPVFMQILVPKGSRGAYISSLSEFETEYEMLFQKGAGFKILEAQENDGKIFIKALYRGVDE